MVAESINWPTVELLVSTNSDASMTVTVSRDSADLQSDVDLGDLIDGDRDLVVGCVFKARLADSDLITAGVEGDEGVKSGGGGDGMQLHSGSLV